MDIHHLDPIFKPHRIALVGMGPNPNSGGGKILGNIVCHPTRSGRIVHRGFQRTQIGGLREGGLLWRMGNMGKNTLVPPSEGNSLRRSSFAP
jgi:hypothetical protein